MKKIESKANEIIHAFELATWGEITWKDVLKLLAEALPGTASHMIHHSPDNKKSLSLNWYGIEDTIAKNYEDYFISIDPWADIIAKSNHGEILSSEKVLPALTLKNTEYYCDHLYMMGNTVAWTGMKVNATERENVFLCVHYDYDKYNSYVDSFTYLFKLIKKPFWDAVRNTDKINKLMKINYAELLSSMFTDESCVIIDEHMNIVEINSLALKKFFNEGFASGVKGKLRIHNNDIHSTLMHKVTALAKSTSASDDIMFLKNKYTLYFARLKKISKNITRPILYTPCMIMIVIYPINKQFNKIDVNHIADLFKLTMSEAKLCGEISKGSSLKEASYYCNISYEHARQRIKVIFQKTQTSNQVELRILLNSLSRFT